MCGRYDLSQNPAAIKAQFRVPSVPDFFLSPDVRPTEMKPIVRLDRGGERECVLARWGLVPSWAKDLKFGSRCINARAEGVATTPSFRGAYAKRHCLVPLNAFFEWSGEKGHRIKWRIRLKDEPLFALAGLWEWWRDPATQQGIETYTIITTSANTVIAPLHDRMPVIVGAPDYARWLDSGADSKALLVPFADEELLIEKT
ncbi:MAG TPA: SOS response-associated peptidase [Burkholderiaceae bacterium]|nr:SOS response-associated peptidase [Burkholderiaceae bacterium]HQR69853.1 SOS response-associated peptidase [Burkholderiaceae bacterium]